MEMIFKLHLMTMTIMNKIPETQEKGRFKWTKERTQKLVELYTNNYSIQAIALYFEVSVNSINGKIKRLKNSDKI